jgi:hypothetical protein
VARFAAESALERLEFGFFDCGKAKARIGPDVFGTRSLDIRSLFRRIRIRNFEKVLRLR